MGDQIDRKEMDVVCSMYEGQERCTQFLVGNPEGRRSPRHTWKDNIKRDLKEVVWGEMDWIDLAEDRDGWRALIKVAMRLRFP
jgi:hypothetical protein